MDRKRKYYTVEEKLQVLRELHESGMTRYAFSKKSGYSQELLSSWLKRFEPAKECLDLPSESTSEEDMANRSKDDYREEVKMLKKRIKELEKSLEFSRLETRVRDMMIDKAEDYFNITIRKKHGAK